MWTPFVYNDMNYMLKLKCDEIIYIYLTDIKNIWYETFEKEAIINRFKEENTSVADLNFELCIKQISLLLENISKDNGVIKLEKEGNHTMMDIKTKVAGFNIKFKMHFILGGIDMFSKEITVPLLQTIGHLEQQQKNLVELLVKKDNEIQEHIYENGDITRKHIKTEPFDKDLLKVPNESELFLNVFSKCSKFNSIFMEKHKTSNIVITSTEETNKQSRKKPRIHKPKNLNKKMGFLYDNNE